MSYTKNPKTEAGLREESKKLDDFFIAEAFENLGGQEAYILERDSGGELKYPIEYQNFINEVLAKSKIRTKKKK